MTCSDDFFTENGEEFAYTDSMFWLGPELVKNLIEFVQEYKEDGVLFKEESCIYADFLDCFVTLPESDRHESWSESVSKSTVKRLIAKKFGEGRTPLEILVMEKSFYHDLGTMSLCKYSLYFYQNYLKCY